MKFALDSNGERILPTKGMHGRCQLCGSELISHCGPKIKYHWHHKNKKNCDHWWENRTDWHLNWQNSFPDHWQEVTLKNSNGEVHRADIKTDEGWIIEFQHSPIKPEERQARNDFYQKIIWVVDGNARKNDLKQFQDRLDNSSLLYRDPKFLENFELDECRLADDWHESNALVFFDFNGAESDDESFLWFLFPKTSKRAGNVVRVKRTVFVKWFITNKFSDVVRNSIIPLHNEMLLEAKRMGMMQHNTIKNSLEYFR